MPCSWLLPTWAARELGYEVNVRPQDLEAWLWFVLDTDSIKQTNRTGATVCGEEFEMTDDAGDCSDPGLYGTEGPF